jgi:hypothetical protein
MAAAHALCPNWHPQSAPTKLRAPGPPLLRLRGAMRCAAGRMVPILHAATACLQILPGRGKQQGSGPVEGSAQALCLSSALDDGSKKASGCSPRGSRSSACAGSMDSTSVH